MKVTMELEGAKPDGNAYGRPSLFKVEFVIADDKDPQEVRRILIATAAKLHKMKDRTP